MAREHRLERLRRRAGELPDRVGDEVEEAGPDRLADRDGEPSPVLVVALGAPAERLEQLLVADLDRLHRPTGDLGVPCRELDGVQALGAGERQRLAGPPARDEERGERPGDVGPGQVGAAPPPAVVHELAGRRGRGRLVDLEVRVEAGAHDGVVDAARAQVLLGGPVARRDDRRVPRLGREHRGVPDVPDARGLRRVDRRHLAGRPVGDVVGADEQHAVRAGEGVGEARRSRRAAPRPPGWRRRPRPDSWWRGRVPRRPVARRPPPRPHGRAGRRPR